MNHYYATKPRSIRLILTWLKAKIIIFVVFSIFISIMFHHRPDLHENSGFSPEIRAFMKGAADEILEMTSLEDAYVHDPGYATARVVTGFFFIISRSVLVLYFLVRRKKTGFWTMFIIDTMVTICRGLPIFNFVLFFVMVSKSGRSYFRKAEMNI